MLFDDSYKTIANAAEGLYRDRGSRFIALAFPITDESGFKKHYIDLKKIHHKANHHCYALRLTPDRSVFKFSDDREPSGSAGRPILNAMLSADVTDCAIVVARYFGGTLLGIPGLINAYKAAAEDALKHAAIIVMQVVEYYELHFSFGMMNDVMQLLKIHEAIILSNEYQNECIIRFSIGKNKADALIRAANTNYLLNGIKLMPVSKP